MTLIDLATARDRMRPNARPSWCAFLCTATKYAAGAMLLGVVLGLAGIGLAALAVIS